MKLVLIFGDSAVGKMTVGQELMKLTNLRLFHNHMTIEPVLEIFGYFDAKTILRLRDVVFEEFAKSNLEGLIFTYMWAFDCKEDWAAIEAICNLFLKQNAELYFVELDAPLDVRLERNKTENRLKHKASKRNVEVSNQRVIQDAQKHRFVSNEGEIPYPNYLRIDNTEHSADVVAKMIQERFKL